MSNEPTTAQMNEIIALFDGWKLIHGEPNHVCPSCDEGKVPSGWCTCDQKSDRFQKDGKMVDRTYFRYHLSWDALKPVIDEIFRYAISEPEQVRPITALSVIVDIKAAHEKVFKFAQWHNQSTDTNEA